MVAHVLVLLGVIFGAPGHVEGLQPDEVVRLVVEIEKSRNITEFAGKVAEIARETEGGKVSTDITPNVSLAASAPLNSVKTQHDFIFTGAGSPTNKDSRENRFFKSNAQTILSIVAEGIVFSIFVVGIISHALDRKQLAFYLFMGTIVASCGSYYLQDMILNEHTKVTMTINIFAALFYRSFIFLLAKMQAYVRGLLFPLMFFDAVANAVMFVECLLVNNSPIEDPKSHEIEPLVWFFSNHIAHHVVRNVAYTFPVFFYYFTHRDGIEENKRGRAGNYAGIGLAGGAPSDFYSPLALAMYVSGAAYAWFAFNNILFCVEALLYVEGEWSSKVCRA